MGPFIRSSFILRLNAPCVGVLIDGFEPYPVQARIKTSLAPFQRLTLDDSVAIVNLSANLPELSDPVSSLEPRGEIMHSGYERLVCNPTDNLRPASTAPFQVHHITFVI